MSGQRWPLIDDDDPFMRLLGYFALATWTYWLIAPLLILSEVVGECLEEIFANAEPPAVEPKPVEEGQ